VSPGEETDELKGLRKYWQTLEESLPNPNQNIQERRAVTGFRINKGCSQTIIAFLVCVLKLT